MKHFAKQLAIIHCMLFLLSLFGTASVNAEPNSPDVLIYAVGGDLETEQAALTKDIYEMIRVMRSYPEQNVFAYLCGSERWWLPELTDKHTYLIRISAAGYSIETDLGETEGTNDVQLMSFLTYAEDGDSLIFWGHGTQGLSGIGSLQNNDTLSLPEIKSALDSIRIHFHLIGFDACSMATLQAAWMLGPYCDQFCASIEEESVDGWSYTALLPHLLQEQPAITDNVWGAFRQTGMTVIDSARLLECQTELNSLLESTSFHDRYRLLSNLFTEAEPATASRVRTILSGNDLLISAWEKGEYPDDDLLPGIGDTYRSFLMR